MATYSNPAKLFKPFVNTAYNAKLSYWFHLAICTPMDENRRPQSEPVLTAVISVYDWTTHR